MMLAADSYGGEGMPPISRLSSVLRENDTRRHGSSLAADETGARQSGNPGRPRNFESICSVPGSSYRAADARVLDGRPNARYDITSSEMTMGTPMLRSSPKHQVPPKVESTVITLETDENITLR